MCDVRCRPEGAGALSNPGPHHLTPRSGNPTPTRLVQVLPARPPVRLQLLIHCRIARLHLLPVRLALVQHRDLRRGRAQAQASPCGLLSATTYASTPIHLPPLLRLPRACSHLHEAGCGCEQARAQALFLVPIPHSPSPRTFFFFSSSARKASSPDVSSGFDARSAALFASLLSLSTCSVTCVHAGG